VKEIQVKFFDLTVPVIYPPQLIELMQSISDPEEKKALHQKILVYTDVDEQDLYDETLRKVNERLRFMLKSVDNTASTANYYYSGRILLLRKKTKTLRVGSENQYPLNQYPLKQKQQHQQKILILLRILGKKQKPSKTGNPR
jgi:hypothetical protein